MTLMYDDLAPWFHLVTHPDEYVEEAAVLHDRLVAFRLDRSGDDGRPTMLELGCGGGNNASHLGAHYELTLVDRSPNMLALSRKLNPDAEHVEGDMTSLRLQRRFDTVLVHDAIMYAATADDLSATLATAAVHLEDGGVAVFAPDCVRETFDERIEHGGGDAPNGMRLRYLEWIVEHDLDNNWYDVAFAYMLHHKGKLRTLDEVHRFGIFSRAQWLDAINQAGLMALRTVDGQGADLFLGIRPWLKRMVVDPGQAAVLHSFLTGNDWPFHSGDSTDFAAFEKRWFVDDVIAMWWLTPGGDKIGVTRAYDLHDPTAMFDLRIDEAHRGKGYGRRVLLQLTEWIFAYYPSVVRIEGYTRDDNEAMQRVMRSVGYRQEARHHKAWDPRGDDPHDAIGFAIHREEWAGEWVAESPLIEPPTLDLGG